jgi:hypothetical protein
MGEYRAPNGTRSFQPDNTPDKLYIEDFGVTTLGDLMISAKEHFGHDVELEELTIEAEHIQTSCLGYDAYDGADWDNFIILTRES